MDLNSVLVAVIVLAAMVYGMSGFMTGNPRGRKPRIRLKIGAPRLLVVDLQIDWQ